MKQKLCKRAHELSHKPKDSIIRPRESPKLEIFQKRICVKDLNIIRDKLKDRELDTCMTRLCYELGNRVSSYHVPTILPYQNIKGEVGEPPKGIISYDPPIRIYNNIYTPYRTQGIISHREAELPYILTVEQSLAVGTSSSNYKVRTVT